MNGATNLTDYYIIRGVVKRLWDTTDTFHFPFGEMTTTPYHFAMPTGLGFAGELLVYQEDFHTNRVQLFHLFLWSLFPMRTVFPIVCLSI